jgi:hypothetical protein
MVRLILMVMGQENVEQEQRNGEGTSQQRIYE